MSANVESMFYTEREKPWHGLGTAVPDVLCSAEALEKAGLDWNVEARPIFTDNGIVIPNYKANTRDIDNKVLGIVHDRYKIVQNKDAFSFTDSLISGDVRYETAGSLNGGRRIWLLAKMPTAKVLGDDVEPYLCFTNTHDGTGSIKVMCTPTRVVCNNTLNLALHNAKRKWSVRHVGNIEAKFEEARETLELANRYNVEFAKEADKLANIKIDFDTTIKMLEKIFPVKEDDSDRKKANLEKIKNDYQVCWLAPDLANFTNTGWGAINAMSDMITHRTPNRLTKDYQENNFEKIIDGHNAMDQMYEMISSLA